MKEFIRKEKYSNQVCQYIQDKILSGEYPDGYRLVETKIAKDFGISQSPVREALRVLEVMGLVETKPYIVCYVRAIDERGLQQVFDLRSLLECFAASTGICNLREDDINYMKNILEQMEDAAIKQNKTDLVEDDVEFHSVVVSAADNPILERIWKLVGATQWTTLTINSHKDLRYFPESHKALLEYAKACDVEGYQKELQNHFKYAAETIATKALRKHTAE